jgi:hypothetical protein
MFFSATKLMKPHTLNENRENTVKLLPKKPPIFQIFYLKLGPKMFLEIINRGLI